MLCFICDKTGNVKRFTNDRLEKCNKMLAFRKKKLFKYQDIVLPRSLHLKGYHIICYNRFTELKSKNRQEFESMSITRPTTENLQALNKRRKPSPKTEKNNALSKHNCSTDTDTEIPLETPALTIGRRETHSHTKEKEEIDESHQVSESSILLDSSEDITKPSSTVVSLESFKMDTEPSFMTDISKAVILKSILTRKTPIKKDILGHTISFASGMDFWPGKMIFNLQADMSPLLNTTEPRIVKTLATQVQRVEPKIVETTLTTCGLCNKHERRIGSQKSFPIKAKQNLEKVMTFARNSNDTELLDKFKRKSSQYHALCLSEYRNKYDRLSRKNLDEEDLIVFKTLHAEAFDAMCAFIDDRIVHKQKIYYLSDLSDRYKALLSEIQDSSAPFDFESSPQNLQEKIANHYYGIVEITTSKTLKRKVVHKCNLKTNLDNAVIENADLKYDKLAFELRSTIKSMKNNTNESSDTPEQLYHFIGSLIQGSDMRQVDSENSVQIKSICESIVSQIHKN